MGEDRPGYTDTPYLPDSEYRVHDPDRPAPPVVETAGAVETPPPSDATVLFDGSDLAAWEHQDGRNAEWTLDGDAMVVEPGSGAIQTADAIGDCQLHLEWATPDVVEGDGQGRGNSGVFFLGEYEIQVLDSHENPTYADGHAAAIYGQRPPLVNAARPPGEWQSYDAVWRGPRFDGDELTRPARLTLFHNGVLVHDAVELNGPTTHRGVEAYEPHPPEGPLRLQDHGDEVRFRNVWYRPLE